MKNFMVILVFIFSVFYLISSCSNAPSGPAGPTNTFTASPTITVTPTSTVTSTPDFYINAWVVNNEASGGEMKYEITFTKDSTPVPDATVIVTDTDAPSTHFPVFNGYLYDFYSYEGATYIHGHNYTTTIYYEGLTFTASALAPGSISVPADGLSATWVYDGSYERVWVQDVDDSYATTHIDQGDLTSPYDIPGSAYPTTGNFRIMITVQRTSAFTPDVGDIKTQNDNKFPITK